MIKFDSKDYYKTKRGLITRIYNNQVRHSKDRGRNLPGYSKEEIISWCFEKSLFHDLYNNWVESNYNINLIPSIDRKINNLPYTFDNIQLMTWQENREKSNIEMKNGTRINLGHPQRSIVGVNKITNKKVFFHSISEAKRQLGIPTSNISSNCKGLRKSAGGYYWKYNTIKGVSNDYMYI